MPDSIVYFHTFVPLDSVISADTKNMGSVRQLLMFTSDVICEPYRIPVVSGYTVCETDIVRPSEITNRTAKTL